LSPPAGRLALDYLPAYAPELNPVEYIWGYGNITSCLTSAPMTSASSAITLDTRCAGMRRRPMLVMAFWQQADLFPL